jgi:ribosome biogenesis GTPase
MSRRKLSEQQQRRIQQNQKNRIHSAEANEGDEFGEANGPDRKGLVIARFVRHIDIRISEGAREGERLRCHVRANLPAITVGDRVIFRESAQQEGVIVALEERHSLIERPDGFGNLKPVAANIDQIFIVIAPEPEPHPNLIDRYLVAAENAGIEARLVFNKSDLLTGENPYAALLESYRALGYPVFTTSCADHYGIETLREAIANRISIFAGQSGVGKSSLVNALVPGLHAPTGTLSDTVSKGRHTTTTASLFELPHGGYLIDSPGIREFHLYHFSRQQVFAGYREFRNAIGHCHFRDCEHSKEPGCAIKAVLNEGKMAVTRRQSLEYILDSRIDQPGSKSPEKG